MRMRERGEVGQGSEKPSHHEGTCINGAPIGGTQERSTKDGGELKWDNMQDVEFNGRRLKKIRNPRVGAG